MEETHQFAIACKDCNRLWRIDLPLSRNAVEAFASVCECGALIVGNYKHHLDVKLCENEPFPNRISEVYLTNGHFIVLDLEKLEVAGLNTLEIE